MASIIRLGRPLRPLRISPPCLSSLTFTRRISAEAISDPENKVQVYISKSRNPYVNLAFEHHLLQTSSPESTILMLYTNSPSIVFGRNQNPWMEVNLAKLAELKSIQLVRRRSGGGTVFHDEGNVNYSVICPPAAFHRDKHAEMVVRALKSLGRSDVRVNKRHDIVMDAADGGGEDNGTFKISGSAYKLTRRRALHHGTCLLRSPNLANISGLLRSPAEAFIKTKGVDSVRSPVRNVEVDNAAFEAAVVDEFAKMYGKFDVYDDKINHKVLSIENVKKGHTELRSRDWIYGQTPVFTFSTHPTEEDPRERPPVPFDFKLGFTSRHGDIRQFGLKGVVYPNYRPKMQLILNKPMQDFADWTARLVEIGMSDADAARAGPWLNDVLGVEFTREN